MKRHAPLLIILSSPSGAGKSSLAREIMTKDPNIRFSISSTTRSPREDEIDGVHYDFVSHEEFMARVARGEMLEYAEVFGNLYGTPLKPVQTALDEGVDIIFDVDWQGGDQIRASVLKEHVVSIFVLPPTISELHQRLRLRASDSVEVIDRRMRQSKKEISHWQNYDFLIVNREIGRASEELQSVITAERLRRSRWTGALNFIADLDEEFDEIWDE